MTKVRFLSQRTVEVPETCYQADLEVYDRFKDFSAELLRLSLAGPGVLGVFLTIMASDKSDSFSQVQAVGAFFYFARAP